MVISYFNYLWDIEGISAGSAIKAKEFVAAIRRRGHEVHLEWRTPQPENNNGAAHAAEKNGRHLLEKYAREPKRYLVNFKHLAREHRILRKQQPDIFFPRLTYGNFSCLLLSRWLNLPTVVEADCPPTYEWEAFYGRDAFKMGDVSLKLELASLNQADAVITQSNQLRDYYVSLGVAAEKVYMIPNAADTDKFKPQPKDDAIVRKHGLHDKVVIGWLGAGVSWTGIDATIDAMRTLLADYPSVCFLMLGSPENMAFFRQHFPEDDYGDRVLLPGFVPHEQIPDYLSCMDIVLAPYPKMAFFYASSMKLFEYMAVGKPVVATRIGQIAEIIEEGRNGLLFDPQTPGELYEKVSALVASEELRERIGNHARKDAESEWNWNRVAEKMEDVFEQVLSLRDQVAQ